jgi:two-component system nitrate/nitrite response regulator NarL
MLEPILASNNSQPDVIEAFTNRENEILELITQGLPNKEIAIQVGISERAVEFRIVQIYRKLNLTSWVELAMWATKHQICGF